MGFRKRVPVGAKRVGKSGHLPDLVERFIGRHGEVWRGYETCGDACARAGPLDERGQRLVKLGIAIGARMEGATRAHVRKCLAAGITPAEVEHAAILALTTIGFPSMMAAYGWVTEAIKKWKPRSS